MSSYILDQTWEREADRLRGLEQWADPVTIEHLAGIGVGPGWRCLEVGAGAGSIARHLARIVTPGGSVLAIDLDTRLVDADASDVLEVRRLDMTTDELPGGFDLVHARLVVGHLADRREALRRLASALRPGGVLLVEENDFIWTDLDAWPVHNDAELGDLMTRVWKALIGIWKPAGYDGHFGRRLAGEMVAAGLAGVRGEARSRIDGSGAVVTALSVMRFRDTIVASGAVTEAEMEHYLRRCLDGELLTSSPLQVSIQGTRPV